MGLIWDKLQGTRQPIEEDAVARRPQMETTEQNPEHQGMKIVVPLPATDWHPYAREGLWAKDLGEGLYRLQNSPFYAYDLSWQDIVSAQEVDGQLVFDEVVERGGHSTYRIFLEEGVKYDSDAFRRSWQPLEQLGCSFEQGKGRLYAVDVPPSTDVQEAYNLLEVGVTEGVWDFEEGHCGHLASGDKSGGDSGSNYRHRS